MKLIFRHEPLLSESQFRILTREMFQFVPVDFIYVKLAKEF